MGRKIKQTGLAISLLGGAYLYGQAISTGAENYGVQFEKQALSVGAAEQKPVLSERSDELTRESLIYFAGSLGGVALGCRVGLQLRDETVARQRSELADELNVMAFEIKAVADNLFDSNRAILNGLSEYELRTPHPFVEKIVPVKG